MKGETEFTFTLRKGFAGQLYWAALQAVCLPPRGRASWHAAAWIGRFTFPVPGALLA